MQFIQNIKCLIWTKNLYLTTRFAGPFWILDYTIFNSRKFLDFALKQIGAPLGNPWGNRGANLHHNWINFKYFWILEVKVCSLIMEVNFDVTFIKFIDIFFNFFYPLLYKPILSFSSIATVSQCCKRVISIPSKNFSLSLIPVLCLVMLVCGVFIMFL